MIRRGRYEVWAPIPDKVELVIEGHTYQMSKLATNWWEPVDVPEELLTGEHDYGFLVDGEGPIPDPRSKWQPYGVHGLSRTFDPDEYIWQDEHWTGKQLAGSITYELHVGTFTKKGTLRSAIDKLDYLAELGIDFIELMPVAAFNGPRGWGYDGVLWYAVHEEYGGPAAYQEFVDACHLRGIGVIQDVVYNHFGPSGNYLPKFAPYQNPDIKTPWGDAVNLDGEDSDEVRAYIIENAIMWCRDYHVDGLRLDAVHALLDNRAIHILEELKTEMQVLSTALSKPISLIAESDMNNPRVISPVEAGGYGIDAQWSDDFHHALVANLAGDDTGYYADFASLEALGKVLEAGFFHDGTESTFRGRHHGKRIDVPNTPMWRLVVFSDNHDQIGNRPYGDRLWSRANPRQLGIAAIMTLLSGFTPMIFMGEEWGAETPFQYFTSHPEPELAELVRQGRIEECSRLVGAENEAEVKAAGFPDPQAKKTFIRSKLDWDEPSQDPHQELLLLNQRLIALRREYPDLVDPRFAKSGARFDPEQQWFVMERGPRFSVVVNFGTEPTTVPMLADFSVLLTLGGVEKFEEEIFLEGHSAAVTEYLSPANYDLDQVDIVDPSVNPETGRGLDLGNLR